MSADLDGRLGVQHRCPRALPGALMGVLLSATLGGAGVARGDELAWGRPAGELRVDGGRVVLDHPCGEGLATVLPRPPLNVARSGRVVWFLLLDCLLDHTLEVGSLPALSAFRPLPQTGAVATPRRPSRRLRSTG